MKKVLFCLLFIMPFVGSSQIVTTIAGNGTIGYTGDGGPATNAQLCREPGGVCVDNLGNVFFADWTNNVVRKISADGIITTVAGKGPDSGYYTGDGGPATNALLDLPLSVLFHNGNLYISDAGNNAIRMINPSGIITTIAGTGGYGYNGDGILATNALLNGPGGMAFDASGNLYFADESNYRVRKINADGIISTIAGNGTIGFSGDGGPATAAHLNAPLWVTINSDGDARKNTFTGQSGIFKR